MDKLPTDKIYDDLFHPAFEATGKVLSLAPRAIRVALSPFEKWIIEGEKNLDLISEAVSEILADVDPQNIIEPEAYIAVPALQGISYCMDNDELRSLYAKLLASAMQIDKKDFVLPAFSEIIKQMSPIDAFVMQLIHPNDVFPIVDAFYQKPTKGLFANLPDFRFPSKGLKIFENLSIMLDDTHTRQEISISLENLSRLGLIQISPDCMEEDRYKPFPLLSYCSQWKSALAKVKQTGEIPTEIINIKPLLPDVEFALIPKSFYVTNFGKSFYKTCIS